MRIEMAEIIDKNCSNGPQEEGSSRFREQTAVGALTKEEITQPPVGVIALRSSVTVRRRSEERPDECDRSVLGSDFYGFDVFNRDVRRARRIFDVLCAENLEFEFAEQIAELLLGHHIFPESFRRLHPVAGESAVTDSIQQRIRSRPRSAWTSRFEIISVTGFTMRRISGKRFLRVGKMNHEAHEGGVKRLGRQRSPLESSIWNFTWLAFTRSCATEACPQKYPWPRHVRLGCESQCVKTGAATELRHFAYRSFLPDSFAHHRSCSRSDLQIHYAFVIPRSFRPKLSLLIIHIMARRRTPGFGHPLLAEVA